MRHSLFLSFALLLLSCIVRPQSTDTKFIAQQHRWWREGFNLDGQLINKVHAPHLDIAYTYGDNCPPEERDNDEALTAAIGKALRAWLQPLRDYTDKPIVEDFRSQRVAVPRPHDEDLRVIFHCNFDTSNAQLRDNRPVINMRRGMRTAIFMNNLIHEVGHAFGLSDTYKGKPGPSTGGLPSTKGTQPASIMSSHSHFVNKIGDLGQDDINGIVWLYRHRHEGLPLEECLFPDYELEETPRGCRPKHPLLFEIKQGKSFWAREVLKNDPDIDINVQDKEGLTALHHAVLKGYLILVARLTSHQDIKINVRDAKGMTALHYAVLSGSKDLVARLIAHQDIKPFLKNADGHRALDLAQQRNMKRIVTLIAAHPKAMPVAAKGKQTTTWGELKKEE